MILITVGLEKYPFDRLLRRMDEWVDGAAIREPVFAQFGHSTYRPRHFDSCQFLPFDEMRRRIASADRVICHAGVGTILLSLRLGKHPFVVPRHAAFGEHVDDHQLDLCSRLDQSKRITVVNQLHEMPDLLEQAPPNSAAAEPDAIVPKQAQLEIFLRQTLKAWHGN